MKNILRSMLTIHEQVSFHININKKKKILEHYLFDEHDSFMNISRAKNTEPED